MTSQSYPAPKRQTQSIHCLNPVFRRSINYLAIVSLAEGRAALETTTDHNFSLP